MIMTTTTMIMRMMMTTTMMMIVVAGVVMMLITFTMTIMMRILMFVVVRVARPMMTSYPSSFPECRCSNEGAVSAACNRLTGQCACKSRSRGRTYDECQAGTLNMDSGNPHGCQACFGYGRATGCASAACFVRSHVTSNFTAANASE